MKFFQILLSFFLPLAAVCLDVDSNKADAELQKVEKFRASFSPIAQSPSFSAQISRDCKLSCPSGVPKSKSDYVSKPNGCDPQGTVINFSKLNIPGFDECCNNHDNCKFICPLSRCWDLSHFSRSLVFSGYSLCNSDRYVCDAVFFDCLRKECKIMRPDSLLRTEESRTFLAD